MVYGNISRITDTFTKREDKYMYIDDGRRYTQWRCTRGKINNPNAVIIVKNRKI